jgi:hypothetical protein
MGSRDPRSARPRRDARIRGVLDQAVRGYPGRRRPLRFFLERVDSVDFTRVRTARSRLGGIGRQPHRFWCARCHASRCAAVGRGGIGWLACHSALIFMTLLDDGTKLPSSRGHRDRCRSAPSVIAGVRPEVPEGPDQNPQQENRDRGQPMDFTDHRPPPSSFSPIPSTASGVPGDFSWVLAASAPRTAQALRTGERSCAIDARPRLPFGRRRERLRRRRRAARRAP